MLDLEAYYDRVANLLRLFPYLSHVEAEPPTVEGALNHWRMVSFKIKCTFSDGSSLNGNELLRMEQRAPKKKRHYHYMSSENVQIFRASTHGVSVPIDHPLSLHRRDGQPPLEHGDCDLNGTDLIHFDLHSAFACIRLHIEEGRLPWP